MADIPPLHYQFGFFFFRHHSVQIILSDKVEMRWTHWDWTAGGTWSRRSLCGPPAAPAAWWPAPDLSGPDLTEWPQLGTVWTRAPPENTEPRPWLYSCIQCVPLAHKLWPKYLPTFDDVILKSCFFCLWFFPITYYWNLKLLKKLEFHVLSLQGVKDLYI